MAEYGVRFATFTGNQDYQVKRYQGYTADDVDVDGYSSLEDDCYDDDVFMDDHMGRDENKSTSKPLLLPRKRRKGQQVQFRGNRTIATKKSKILKCALYITSTIAVVLLTLFLVYTFVGKSIYQSHSDTDDLVPCTNIEVEDVWVVGFPKLTTESAFRLLDVNLDGDLDVIFGFGTGVDGYHIPDVVCDIYFNGTKPCFGGLMALNGADGTELWRHYADHELFGINCNFDIDGDGVNDCLAGGRAGAFRAVSGRYGTLLWVFDDKDARNEFMNVYTAQFISDLNEDNVPDILVSHGGDPLEEPGSAHRLVGELLILSGKTGEVFTWSKVPDQRETYYSPQVYMRSDNKQYVLFGTGGETHPGGLWYISLDHLYRGDMDKAKIIFEDDYKGMMTPPVLLDLNHDGVEDIVVPMFNSTVVALDGQTFEIMWNYTFPNAESYSTPAVGYFNNDNVLDFMVKYSTGPGFPVYYHTETTVLDGKNGQPLIPMIKDSVGSQASPLTISVEGTGNDIFVYWISDCVDHDGQGGEFDFVKGTNVHDESRSDICKSRFNTKGYTKLYALNQHLKAPGIEVYNSRTRKKEEHGAWVNTSVEAAEYVRTHPEHLSEYLKLVHPNSHEHHTTTTEKPYFGGRKAIHFLDTQSKTSGNTGNIKELHNTDSASGIEYENEEENKSSKQNSDYQDKFDKSPGVRLGEKFHGDREDTHNENAIQRQNVKDNNMLNKQKNGAKQDISNMDSDLYNQLASVLGKLKDNNKEANDDRYLPYNGDDDEQYKYGSSSSRGGSYGSERRKLPYSNDDHHNVVKNNDRDDYWDDGYYKIQRNQGDYGAKPTHWNNWNSDPEEPSTYNTNHNENDIYSRPRYHYRRPHSNTPGRTSPINAKTEGLHRAHRVKKDVHYKSNTNKKDSRFIKNHDRQLKKFSKGVSKEKSKIPLNKHSLPQFKNAKSDHLQHNAPRLKKRHIGPHDDGGVQRLLSTGTLAPTLLSPDHPLYSNSIDLIFATYWFYPADTKVILPEDQKCIDEKMKQDALRTDHNSAYFGLDRQSFEHKITTECLERRTAINKSHKDTHQDHGHFNPYDIKMGQLTVYRLRVSCSCPNTVQPEKCSKILDYDSQEWAAYMGTHGNSHFQRREN